MLLSIIGHCDYRQTFVNSPFSAAIFYLIIMHKGSKLVNSPRETKMTVPMLSQLYIHLPKPQPTRRIQSNNNQHQQQHLSNIFHLPSSCEDNIKIHEKLMSQQNKADSNCFFSNAKTKNPSQSTSNYRCESEIIRQWVRNLFQKRNLMGPQWEANIRIKQINLLRQAFQSLKEQGLNTSVYLQTQSKHKPHFKIRTHLLSLGIEKLRQLTAKVTSKAKRMAFSKILQFLALQRFSSNPGSKQQGNCNFKIENAHSPTLKTRQLPAKSINIKVQGPKLNESPFAQYKMFANEDYTEMGNSVKARPKERLPSTSQNNEYALASVQVRQAKKLQSPENQLNSQSQLSKKNKRPSKIVQLNEPNSGMHSFNVAGNVKYEFNQHNYIVMHPENIQLGQSTKTNFQNIPNPVFPNATSCPNIKFQCQPINIQPHVAVSRGVNYTRPHSHNPYVIQGVNFNYVKTEAKVIQNSVENRKSRAISASCGNLKISFMGKSITMESPHKINDYEGETNKKSNLQKLGTVENKKLRLGHQANSYGNQLLPMDYGRPQNYIYSTPNSPRLLIPSNTAPLQSCPLEQKSPRSTNFGRHSILPNEIETHKDLGLSIQVNSQTNLQSKRMHKEKLVVTSAQKLRHF